MKNKEARIVSAQPGYFVCDSIQSECGKYFIGFGYDPVIAWAVTHDDGDFLCDPVTVSGVFSTNYEFMMYPDGFYYDSTGIGPQTEESAKERMVAIFSARGACRG